MKEKQGPDISNSLILKGADVSKLPEVLLRSYCEKISAKLKGPNTIPEPPEKLYQAMIEGRTVLAMDELTNGIYGFAQIKSEAATPGVWILNSWTSFAREVGKPVLWSASALAHDLDPKARVIAKVRGNNSKAQKYIIETGGVLLGQETSEQHYNPDSLQPIHKSIFDVSLETLMPTLPLRHKLRGTIGLSSEPTPSGGVWNKINNCAILRKLRWFVSNRLGSK